LAAPKIPAVAPPARKAGLSEDSVRRDLRELAAAGLCQRVYGGALPVSPALGTLKARTEIAPESKRRIAAHAAEMITPGSTVILDSGTTALEIVRALPPDLAATIITHSPSTAAALAEHPTVDVFILGGRLFKHSVAACGAAAAEAAAAISADLYFLGLGGIHPKEGFTTGDPDEAAMKRILVSRAADTYVVGSTEKLGAVCSYQVVRLSEAAGVITDAPGDHPRPASSAPRECPSSIPSAGSGLVLTYLARERDAPAAPAAASRHFDAARITVAGPGTVITGDAPGSL
jgi:DeoR/GlpR family transcriptional regulator of sugar metabolism